MSSDCNRDIPPVVDRDVFMFRQFAVSHTRSAMKVGTDGVLLGAWTNICDGCKRIWDVGAGSGLVALMLAQRCRAEIYGIEIDSDASLDLTDNFNNSPWNDRLHAVNADINICAESLPGPDLIVCNPPYFANSLLNSDTGRKCARHEASLGCGRIVRLAGKYLASDGCLALICPTDRADDIEWETALAGLSIVRRTDVKTTPRKSPKRTLWEISRRKTGSETYSIESMRNDYGSYSDWYINLTKDYYLHLNEQ